MYDFLIIGGGIFGMSTAVELAKRKHKVGLLNPATIPHHLAASTDISKVVRMEYGADTEYFEMAERSIDRWKEWNDFFGVTLYHEVGLMMLCKEKLETERQSFEHNSFKNLEAHGYSTNRMDSETLAKRFPALKNGTFIDGNFNPKAGYVESSLVIETLANYARSLGVDIREGQTADNFLIENGRLEAVTTKEGNTFKCGQAIVAAGANTPYLIPELMPYLKTTGHPVFWLKPENPHNFIPPRFGVFMADISNSGWYGFPFSPKHGVIKIAKHADGLLVHPNKDDRQVTAAEITDFRKFLTNTFPELSNAPLVYTRRCLYTDSLDGHFWIDHHPTIKGLSISTGGSGHGMKMGPMVGEMTADMAEGNTHQFSERYRWRHIDSANPEECRHVAD